MTPAPTDPDVHPHRSAVARPARRPAGRPASRRGAALILALIVSVLAVVLTVALLDAARLRTRAAGNTRDYETARYLAEAGLHRGLAELEADITWRAGFADVPFPAGLSSLGIGGPAGTTYSVTAADGPDGTVLLRATGRVPTPRGAYARVLTATVKQGG